MPSFDPSMGQDTIWVTGINHDVAPISVRERLALSVDDEGITSLAQALRAARLTASEATILSTCNRLEIYALLPHGEGPDVLFQNIFADAIEFRPYIYSYRGDAAIRHLFRVAAGIDSQVLGEVQILGQVQRAWQTAHKMGVAGPVLSQLFHRAVALGKRVHSETPISRQPASISYAAVVLARQIFGSQLEERRALIIGTGEVGEGVARCLNDNGVEATVVVHRQLERGQAIARRYHARAVTWDDLPHCLANADIVISSTSAPHYVLQRQHIEEATLQRGDRPLYLIDLAVPRDIDPSTADLPGVHLHNLDDLHAVVRTTMEERQAVVPEIEVMIDQETVRFSQWTRARSTAPTIKELQALAGEIVRKEIEWAMPKLPNLSQRERQIVEAMASRITGKILHGPIQWLKAQAELEGSAVGEEPDYGMSRLNQRELAGLFYRGADIVDVGDQE
jgi:glutamyl-tRNA reductase